MSIYFTNEWFIFYGVVPKDIRDKIILSLPSKTLPGHRPEGSLLSSMSLDTWEKATVDTSEGAYTEEERRTGRKIEGIQGGVYKPDPKIRISDVYWTTEQWLYDYIWPYMQQANQDAGWNLDISAAEPMQIARYKKGEFYRWHRDGTSDTLSAYDKPENPFIHKNVRKISLSIILNDDFEGGDLEFATYKKEKCEIETIKTKAGDMIFFPPGVEHRVTPVTKGVRYSLVSLFLGPPVR